MADVCHVADDEFTDFIHCVKDEVNILNRDDQEGSFQDSCGHHLGTGAGVPFVAGRYAHEFERQDDCDDGCHNRFDCNVVDVSREVVCASFSLDRLRR